MTISEFEIHKCEKAAKAYLEMRRPPAYMRGDLDFGYKIVDQSVELFEIRPHWKDKTKIIESSIAKCTFVKKQKSMEDLLATAGYEMAQL